MLRGFESVTKGMIGVLDLNDAIANNMANVNSTGFKQQNVVFKNIRDVMINDINKQYVDQDAKNLGTLSLGSTVDAVIIDFRQGGIQTTGNPLDLAINGDGFFSIQTKDGSTAYTRNGSFILDTRGVLTTLDGCPVLGKNGPIILNINNNQAKDIVISGDGTVSVGREIVAQLDIVDFADKNSMEALGNSLYRPKDINSNPPIAAQGVVTQGAIEKSNANVVQSMVNSITASRTYDALNEILKNTSKTLEKNINQVGRVR